MNRREFLQVASAGAATPIFTWEALAQGQADRVLIVSELTANSLDTHTVGANRAAYGVVWMTYDRLITFGTKTSPTESRATIISISNHNLPKAGSSRRTPHQ